MNEKQTKFPTPYSYTMNIYHIKLPNYLDNLLSVLQNRIWMSIVSVFKVIAPIVQLFERQPWAQRD